MRVPIASNRAFISARSPLIDASISPRSPSKRPFISPRSPLIDAVMVRVSGVVMMVMPPSMTVAKSPMSTQLCGSVTAVTFPV